MRAIAVQDFGSAPALVELPDPAPAAGEVLVRVVASSLNGIDLAVAGGYLQGMMEHRFPVVLGRDFAGTVEAVGAGTTRFDVGDAVFGVVMKPVLHDGALGELVAVSESFGTAAVPDGVDPGTAGALGLAGTTALDVVNALALEPGHTVLISGATGGVGVLAVQYAATTGARVIATARPGAGADLVTSLGAAEVVDHTGDLAAQVRTLAPEGVDAVVHLAGDGAALLALLAPHGRLASVLGVGADADPRATAVMASPAPGTLDRLAGDVAAGRLQVPVATTHALGEVPAALAEFTGGKIGKIAIAVS